MTQFRQSAGFFTVSHPSNWTAYPASSGTGVSIVPQAGVANLSNGQQAILEGVIINHYAPFQNGGSGTLKDATDDIAAQVQRSNTYLRLQGAGGARNVGGTRGYAETLAGTSPVTGQPEQVTIATQALPDGHVLYVIGIAPGSQAQAFNGAFDRMLQSLRVNDQAAHRSAN
jgi:hypothetical protein